MEKAAPDITEERGNFARGLEEVGLAESAPAGGVRAAAGTRAKKVLTPAEAALKASKEEMATAASQKARTTESATFHKKNLKAFDEGPEGLELAQLQAGVGRDAKKAEEKVGFIRGALTPGVEAGEPTAEAKEAAGRLGLNQERLDALAERRARLERQARDSDDMLQKARETYHRLNDDRLGLTNEGLARATGAIDTDRLKMGLAPIVNRPEVALPKDEDYNSEDWVSRRVKKVNEERAAAGRSDFIDPKTMAAYDGGKLKRRPGGEIDLLDESAIDRAAAANEKLTGISADKPIARALELGRLKASGVTHVGAQPIDKMIERYGGEQAVESGRLVQSFNKAKTRLAEIEEMLPGMTDKGKAALQDERAVLTQVLAEKVDDVKERGLWDEVRDPYWFEKVNAFTVNAAKGAASALVDTGESLVRNAKYAPNLLLPGVTKLLPDGLKDQQAKTDEKVAEFAQAMRDEAEGWNWYMPKQVKDRLESDFITGDVAKGVGSTAAFFGPSVVMSGIGRMAGLGEKALSTLLTTTVAGTGAASSGNSFRREAMTTLRPQLDAGEITREEYDRAAGLAEMAGGVLGATEAVPFSRFARRVGDLPAGKTFMAKLLEVAGKSGGKTAAQWMKGQGRKLLVDVVSEGLEEAGQEWVQAVASDLAAKQIFDPARDVDFLGAAKNAAVGGFTGLLFSGVTNAMSAPKVAERYRELGDAVKRGAKKKTDGGGDTPGSGVTPGSGAPPPSSPTSARAMPDADDPFTSKGPAGEVEADEELAAELGVKKPAPAEFIGVQEMPGGPGFDLYNLTADIPGHPKGSSVSRETLEKAGFTVPARPATQPAAQPISQPSAAASDQSRAPASTPAPGPAAGIAPRTQKVDLGPEYVPVTVDRLQKEGATEISSPEQHAEMFRKYGPPNPIDSGDPNKLLGGKEGRYYSDDSGKLVAYDPRPAAPISQPAKQAPGSPTTNKPQAINQPVGINSAATAPVPAGQIPAVNPPGAIEERGYRIPRPSQGPDGGAGSAPNTGSGRETAPVPASNGARQGKVGDKLGAGEVVLTSGGRKTTPFPKIATDTDRKATATVRRVDAWLLENAIAEAKARGDDFNLGWMQRENPASLPPATKDSLEEYLFGEQPTVPKPLLKPLVSPTASTAPAAKTTPAAFVSRISSAAKVRPASKQQKFLADFARRLSKASPDAFASLQIKVVPAKEWADSVREAPDSRAAFQPGTNTLFLNGDRVDAENIVELVVHEAGHFAERFYLGEEFTRGEWEKLTDEQRYKAFEQYAGKGVQPVGGIVNLRSDYRARAEWVAMQFARVVRGDTQGMSAKLKAGLDQFLKDIREMVRKWVGDESLTTAALDAKILEMLGYQAEAAAAVEAASPAIAPQVESTAAPAAPEAVTIASLPAKESTTEDGPKVEPTAATDRKVSRLADRVQMKVQKAFLLGAVNQQIAEAPEELVMDAEGKADLARFDAIKYDGTKPGQAKAEQEEAALGQKYGVDFRVVRGKLDENAGDELRKKIQLAHAEHVTIEVPGDGTFRIPHTKRNLTAFADRIRKAFGTGLTPLTGASRTASAEGKPVTPLATKVGPAEITEAVGISQSKDETRYVLNNVVQVGPHTVATDGRRLTVAIGGQGMPEKRAEVERKGKYPNFMQVLPKDRVKITDKTIAPIGEPQVTADAAEIIKVLDRIEGLKDDKGVQTVILHNLDGKLGISFARPDTGDYRSDGLPPEHKGFTGVDSVYLRDAMVQARKLGRNEVPISYVDDRAAIALFPGKNVATIIMPVRGEVLEAPEEFDYDAEAPKPKAAPAPTGTFLNGKRPAAPAPAPVAADERQRIADGTKRVGDTAGERKAAPVAPAPAVAEKPESNAELIKRANRVGMNLPANVRAALRMGDQRVAGNVWKRVVSLEKDRAIAIPSTPLTAPKSFKDTRTDLLNQIDAAIETAPDQDAFLAEANKAIAKDQAAEIERQKKAGNKNPKGLDEAQVKARRWDYTRDLAVATAKNRYVTVQSGNSKFRVTNTKQVLERLRSRVEKNIGRPTDPTPSESARTQLQVKSGYKDAKTDVEKRFWIDQMSQPTLVELKLDGQYTSVAPGVTLTKEAADAIRSGQGNFDVLGAPADSRTKTPEFVRWFGNSKVVDANGDPLVVYHGSKRADRIDSRFRKTRATSGPMAFFTDDPAIASNYATGKEDTSLETPADYSGWFKYKGKGMRTPVSIDRAWWALSPEERQRITQRIYTTGYENADMGEGPIVGNSSSIMGRESIDYELRQARGNGLRALVEIWLNSGSLFNDERTFIDVLSAVGMDMGKVEFDSPWATRSGVFPVYLSIQNPLNTGAIPANVVAALRESGKRKRAKQPAGGNADMWDKNTISGRDWLDTFNEDIAKDSSLAWTRIPDWVSDTLRGMGYDGIQDTGGKMGGDKHSVWIPFDETQVKSATGNSGEFDPANPSILGAPVDRPAILPADETDDVEAAQATARTLRQAVRVASGGSPAVSAPQSGQIPSLREQEEALTRWADAAGLMIEPTAFAAEWRKQGAQGGAENQVYFDEAAQRYVKRNALLFNDDWVSFFRRIMAHNRLFPDTAYLFHGFTPMDDTQPDIASKKVTIQAVLSQPVVRGEGATIDEIGEALTARGFEENGLSGQFEDERFILDDLGGNNVLKDVDGNIRFIDPQVSAKPGIVLGAPAEQDAPMSLQSVRDKWEAQGVENYASERNGVITLSQVIVPKERRGEGLGTAFMEDLTAYADKSGQTIVLTPSTDLGATSKGRLVRFYQRFDFVANSGRNKDYRYRETMLRRPKDRGQVLGTPSEPTPPLNPPKNAKVPGQPGFRYRSHSDSLIEAGIATARQIYKTRGNEADDATAKAIIKELGESVAAELSLDPDADLPGAIKTAIAVNLQRSLNKRRFDKSLSLDERRAAMKMSARLAEVKGEEFTDMGQALQFLSRLNDYSPEGVLIAASREAKARQEKMVGEGGKKAVEQATDAMQKENEKAIDEATADMTAALRAVKVGKSIWQRYRDSAVKRWISSIENATAGERAELPPLVEFTNRLTREVQARIDETLPKSEPRPQRTPAEIIREAVDNRAKYKEAWDAAREQLGTKYADRPEVLEKLDEAMMGLLDRPYSDKTLDRAIKEAHKEMGLKVQDLARMHYRQADALGLSLAEKIAQQAGLKPEDAERLANLVRLRMGKLTADAKKKALARLIEGKTGGARRIFGAADRIIELSNAGALTKDEYFAAVAEELKLPGLTEQQAGKLRDLAEKAQNTPEGFQRDRVLTDLLTEMQKVKGIGPIDVATAVYYAHILSGYTTQMVNAVSTAMNTAADVAVMVARRPTTAAQAIRGIRDGAKTGFVQALSILDTGYAHRSFDEKMPEVAPILEALAKDGDRNAALRAYAKALRYVSRGMKAMDAVFFQSAAEAYQRVAAARLAAEFEGGKLNWQQRAQKVRDLLAMSPAEFEAARQQAKAEGLTGLDYQLRVGEILRQKRDAGLVERGVNFGREATFNQEPRGYLGVAAKAIRDASNKFPPLRLFVPFTNVVANVANASLNYSPVGAVRAVRGYGGEGAPTSAEERDALLIKGIAGSMGLIYLLAYGLGDDDEEMPWITGLGPKDTAARNQLRKTGWKPNTVKIGNAYVSYLETPLAIPLAIVGAYIDGVRYNGLDHKAAGERLAKAIGTVPEVIVSMSFLRGLADFMDAARGRKDWGEIASGVVAGVTVPNLVRQIDRTFDPTLYDTSGVVGSLAGQFPGVRQTFPERIDVVGQPIKTPPIERFGRAATNDELWNTLAAKQAWIPEAGKTTKLDKQTLTPEQYRAYVQLSGPGIEARLRAALPRLKLMTAEQANDFVERVTREERARVKPQLRAVPRFDVD